MNFDKLNCVIQGIDDISLPKMMKVRQKFSTRELADPVACLSEQLKTGVSDQVIRGLKGKRIGITAGSRGIPHYAELMRTLVSQLKDWGAEPFVFPAMGSHAGATGEGQKAYLSQFGITEENIGCPILSSMDVVEIATLDDGLPVYCDCNAAAADGIVIFHKVKPHTHFKDRHESGLLKMICIGIGKHKGASTFHQYGFDDFCHNMERVAEEFLRNINVVFSVGLVQNVYDDLGYIEVIPTEKFIERDAALLEIAKQEMPDLNAFEDIDVLIIDEIGKEISGQGFDPNITGRTEVISQQAAFRAIAPNIRKIALLDISEKSHGLGIGMGYADIVSYRFVNKLDFSSTYTNIITNNYLQGAAMPVYANSDLEAIKICILTSMVKDKSKVKIVRIKNTLSLFEVEVSEAYTELVNSNDNLEIVSVPYYWQFNQSDVLW